MSLIEAKKANQQNALKSTGPRSTVGKAAVSRNSIKHGILSRHLIIRDEDPKDLQTLKNELIDTLSPEGRLEHILVDKILSSLWRLHRLIKAESVALEEKDWMGKPEKLHQAYNSKAMASISRYEATLERSLYRSLHELQRIQGMRLGQALLAPITIDIHSEA
jgi:hypothetical protein